MEERDSTPDDDRLDKLPDDVLLAILDRLHVRDATRTSVLSRRWRHLPAMLSQLNIDFFDIRPDDRPKFCDDEIARLNASTVEATKGILSTRDSSRNAIQSLRVSLFLVEDDTAVSIGRAVGHTMATHNVETAEFMLLTEKHGDYCFDDDFDGNGRRFVSFFDACPVAFGGLTRLRLESLRLGELDIPNILVTCKRLKSLRLEHCLAGISWPVLEAQHSQLSDLAFVECDFVRVELSSLPKLKRMTFTSWFSLEDQLSLGYVPLLEALSLCNVCLNPREMVKLSKFLVGTSLRALKLGFEGEKIWVQPECLTERHTSIFNQLRFVYLDEIPEGYDLTWTLFILEVAPNLKELYLTVWDHLCKMETNDEERKELSYIENKGVEWESSTSNFQHNSLATLVIFGFHHEADYMVRYVRRVMKAAVNLEDVFLRPRPTCRECRGNPPNPCKFPFTELEKCLMGTKITFGLQSSAMVHFLTGEVTADNDARRVFL